MPFVWLVFSDSSVPIIVLAASGNKIVATPSPGPTCCGCIVWWSLFLLFVSFFSLWRFATNQTERLLTTPLLVFLARSQRLHHPDLLVTLFRTAYTCTVKFDVCPFKSALPMYLPDLKVSNVLSIPRPYQPPLRRLFLFVLREFCTTTGLPTKVVIVTTIYGV